MHLYVLSCTLGGGGGGGAYMGEVAYTWSNASVKEQMGLRRVERLHSFL